MRVEDQPFSHFDTPPACDGRAERQTHEGNIYHGSIASCGNKKLSYRRVTARCVLSVVILPVATQQCRNYLYDKS